jgi:hypothetical protein
MRFSIFFPHRTGKRIAIRIRLQKKPFVGRSISARQSNQRDGVLREAPREGHERRSPHDYLP